MNPYAVLGVPPEANEAEIHSAYLALARRYHPDLHPNDPRAGERLIAVNAAYELLSKPIRRSLYDRQHAGSSRGPMPPPESPPTARWAYAPHAESEPSPGPERWRGPTDAAPPRPKHTPFPTKPARPYARTLASLVIVVALIAFRASANYVIHHGPSQSGCLGFATDGKGLTVKRPVVPCTVFGLGIDSSSPTLQVALLGVTWDRGGTKGDLLHICLGITSRQNNVNLQSVQLPLRLLGPSGIKLPVATGIPGKQAGFRCGPRRSYDWPGFLQDVVFLIPPGERNHTLLISSANPQILSLGGA